MDNNILKGNIFSLANVDAQKVLNSLEDEVETSPAAVEIGRKRKRLDDFTPQEKMVRRKLKNRVAAQNARDRKRERMDQLETVVDRLEKENKELKKSNNELRSNMSILMSHNKTMREKLGITEMEFQVPKSLESKPIITPTVRDHDHIVIKKEEQSETEYAAETSGSSCFFSHDVVSQSQAGELLTLLERIGAGSGGQVLVTEEIDCSKSKQQQKQQQQSTTSQQGNKVDSIVIANGPCSDNTELSSEDAELFSLCQEIQDLVDGSSNLLTEKDMDVVSLLAPGNKDFYSTTIADKFNVDNSSCTSDPLSEIFNLVDSDSGFGSEDDNNDFQNASSLEDDLLDLFPDLASL